MAQVKDLGKKTGEQRRNGKKRAWSWPHWSNSSRFATTLTSTWGRKPTWPKRAAKAEYYEFPEPPNLLKKSHSIFYIEPLC
jgi:hypothetical protein